METVPLSGSLVSVETLPLSGSLVLVKSVPLSESLVLVKTLPLSGSLVLVKSVPFSGSYEAISLKEANPLSGSPSFQWKSFHLFKVALFRGSHSF